MLLSNERPIIALGLPKVQADASGRSKLIVQTLYNFNIPPYKTKRFGRGDV